MLESEYCVKLNGVMDMRGNLKLILSFCVAGVAAGIVIAFLQQGPSQTGVMVSLYYGIAAVSAGLIWVLLNSVTDLEKNRLNFALACIASAVVAGNVLLSFGYYVTSYNPDPTLFDHVGASVSFAIGALVFGFLSRKLKEKQETQNTDCA